MIAVNINTFSPEWLRPARRQTLSDRFPAADAFQQLCGDILSLNTFQQSIDVHWHLLPLPTLGRDGAVDHIAHHSDGQVTLIECKQNDTVAGCLNELKKLKKKLLTHLPDCATAYPSWFDPRFTQYIFCTSCVFNTPQDANTIHRFIVDDILKPASALRPDLAHLHQVQVRVYSWQQLKPWLEASPLLYHLWVDEQIAGIDLITHENIEAEGYQSYLSAQKLPYYSRDEHRQQYPDAKELLSETALVRSLITETFCKGIVIHGQGGMGKTRLAKELALLMTREAWTAFAVKPFADAKQLISLLRPQNQYALVFDYLEEFGHFQEIIERLKELSIPVKIIANCRSSYFFSHVRTQLNKWQMQETNISGTSPAARLYYESLIQHMVNQLPALARQDKALFERKPSFAAAFHYLATQNDTLAPAEGERFGQMIVPSIFRSIAHIRHATVPADAIVHIFSSLPAYGAGYDDLMTQYQPYIKALLQDRWIEKRSAVEEEREYLHVIHDTITDKVLIDHLHNQADVLPDAVEALLMFAADHFHLTACLQALTRIKDEPVLANTPILSVFYQLIARRHDDKATLVQSIILSPLVTNEQAIQLLNHYEKATWYRNILTQEISPLLINMQVAMMSRQLTQQDEQDAFRHIAHFYKQQRAFIFTDGDGFRVMLSYLSIKIIRNAPVGYLLKKVAMDMAGQS